MSRYATLISIFICYLAPRPTLGFPRQSTTQVRVVVQGSTNLVPEFVDQLRREFRDNRMELFIVDRSADYEYNIVIAQESTLGSAAGAVVVLDRSGSLVTTVVRSGRLSGKGALNASAKELAKNIAKLKARP